MLRPYPRFGPRARGCPRCCRTHSTRSRGAGRCTFVERDRRALEALRENLRRCGLEGDRALAHLRADPGIRVVTSPRHAAVLVIVGAIPHDHLDALAQLRQLPRRGVGSQLRQQRGRGGRRLALLLRLSRREIAILDRAALSALAEKADSS